MIDYTIHMEYNRFLRWHTKDWSKDVIESVYSLLSNKKIKRRRNKLYCNAKEITDHYL